MPLDRFERFAVASEDIAKLAQVLVAKDHLSEVVVLSTCNRTEIYGLAERFHGAYADVRQVMSDLSGLPVDQFHQDLYVHWDDAAVHHLFSVVAGLDSAVIGESEILGQVRDAWASAQADGTAGSTLNLLFRRALETGKRARRETTIAQHTTSVSGAAVELAAAHSELSDASVLVIGAGAMARSMARTVATVSGSLTVANRSLERAGILAEEIGARSIGLSDLADALAAADVVLSATGAVEPVLTYDDVAAAVGRRDGRPLLMVDVAMPRDIDPGASAIDGVALLDMDDVRVLTQAGLERRRDEIAAVLEIVDDEVLRYRQETTAREAGPVIGALRASLEQTRIAEIERYAGRLDQLDPEARELVEQLTRSMIAKVVHQPTVGLREAAGTLRGDRLCEATRSLFDLD